MADGERGERATPNRTELVDVKPTACDAHDGSACRNSIGHTIATQGAALRNEGPPRLSGAAVNYRPIAGYRRLGPQNRASAARRGSAAHLT
jgi:hypothetical protein